jgi:hypothetical protein
MRLGVEILWNLTLCRWVSGSRRFEGSWSFYPQRLISPGRMAYVIVEDEGATVLLNVGNHLRIA